MVFSTKKTPIKQWWPALWSLTAMADSKELTLASASCCQSEEQEDSTLKKPKNEEVDLPTEIIVEILSRLPVKTLFQCRCVCKSFKSIISDPRFIKIHLRNYHAHRIVLNFQNTSIYSCSIPTILNNSRAGNAVDLDSYRLEERIHYDWIVGSCNGLLCLARKQDSVVLLNPSTRLFNELPLLPFRKELGSYITFGFGYDSAVDDYKVVSVFCSDCNNKTESMVHVFTLKTNCWRMIGSFESGIPCNVSGKYVNGTLNWPVKCVDGSRLMWNIVSFDLATETYKEVMQPAYDQFVYNRMLGVLDGFLCVMCTYTSGCVDLWVMKDYGVKDSWQKMVRIRDPGLMFYSVPNGVGNNGEVLLEFNFSLVIYNSKDDTFRYPSINGRYSWSNAEIYNESLVSPNVEN